MINQVEQQNTGQDKKKIGGKKKALGHQATPPLDPNYGAGGVVPGGQFAAAYPPTAAYPAGYPPPAAAGVPVVDLGIHQLKIVKTKKTSWFNGKFSLQVILYKNLVAVVARGTKIFDNKNQYFELVRLDSETDSNHDTALTLACAGGHEELVTLLLSRHNKLYKYFRIVNFFSSIIW